MTTVEIADGRLAGEATGDVVSFKGIPYSAPPVGELRWRAPQPVIRWTGLRDATRFGDDCSQAPSSEPIAGATSEDCLFVNVWAPSGVATGDALPVLVWIHGGGYVGGGSSIPFYDGSAFARQGMVVVSLNYRLSRFGFFAHPALIDAAEDPVGNYGYLDQIQALRWVRANISAFGGDPDRVTLMGESAGGASVIQHLVTPHLRGLFHQAVCLSGGGREALLSREMDEGSLTAPSAQAMDALFAGAHGVIGHDAAALAKLRDLPADVLAGDDNLDKLGKIRLLGGQIPGIPAVDGAVVVGQPVDQFERGGFMPVPLIIGSTAMDIPLHFPPSRVHPMRWFGEDESEARAAYRVPQDVDAEALIKVLLSVGADMTMHEPAHYIAATMREVDQPAWVYRFTYTAQSTRPGAPGQVHAGELPFLFDRLAARYGDDVAEKDQAIASAFNRYIGNFVLSGDPNAASLPRWELARPGTYDVLDFTLDDGPVYGPDPRPTMELVARARERERHDRAVAG